MSSFYQKHFLKLLDFTPAEINALLLAAKLKTDKKNGKNNKNLVKTSRSSSKKTQLAPGALSKLPHLTRALASRISAQAAVRLGIKNQLRIPRVLGRMYDGIQYRGYGQEIVETGPVCRCSGVERPDQ
jgi:ornithine carbamoyltransferase